MNELYYIPPTDEIFNELKERAIYLWKTFDNTYGYVDKKIERVEKTFNIRDNFMYIVSMFDMQRQMKLANMLSEETRKAVRDRMIY